MKSVTFLLLLLMFGPPLVSAQNITGKWYGKLTQDPGGYKNLYEFELELVQDDVIQKNFITGTSYAYVPYQVEARLGLSGLIDGDTVRLSESEFMVREDVAPQGWEICIKKLHLNYFTVNNKEFLRGRWTGQTTSNSKTCKPGLIILARNKKDLKEFLDNSLLATSFPKSIAPKSSSIHSNINKASGYNATPGDGGSLSLSNAGPSSSFSTEFKNTTVSKISELEVDNQELKLYLLDYSKVDNDSITVFLNREVLLEKVAITERPVVIKFTLESNSEIQELLLYAHSVGDIPPNTAGIGIKDGEVMHKIKIRSDRDNTSAVYLKLKKKDTPR